MQIVHQQRTPTTIIILINKLKEVNTKDWNKRTLIVIVILIVLGAISIIVAISVTNQREQELEQQKNSITQQMND
jgi:NADH:ubiquinone oxidoreductase subunit 6 (subunit J)